MSYSVEWAGALADVQAAGAAVTFSLTTDVLDPSTSTYVAGATVTVPGYAISRSGNPIKYAALGLLLMEAPTLVFVPSTYGNLPGLGYSVVWNSTTYLVKDVDPVGPDGPAILAKVIVAR